MSAFELEHAEDIKDPEYAYAFGRNERELEIIKLLEEKKSSLKQFRKAGQISLVNNEEMIDRIITAIKERK